MLYFAPQPSMKKRNVFRGTPLFPISSLLCPSATLGRHLRLNDGVVCVEEPGTPSVFGKFCSPLIYTAIVSHVTNITNRKTRGEKSLSVSKEWNALYLLKSYPYFDSYLYLAIFYSFCTILYRHR